MRPELVEKMQNPFVNDETDYCDIIAKISSNNKDSLVWWACEASSKNFGNSELWKSFYQWPVELIKEKNAPSFLYLFSLAAYSMVSEFFAIPLKLKMKNFFTKNSKGRILFFSHFNDSLWEDNNYKDPYFQPLMNFLNNNKDRYDSIAFTHGSQKAIRKHCLEKFASKNRVFPIELFSSPLIILKSLLISLTCKPKLKEARVFRGKDILPLIRIQCKRDRRNGNIFHNLCIYFSLKKALKKLRPERVIWPWENHCWEKLMLLAKREASPETIAIGYQHSTISMYLLNHFPGKNECACVPFPDKILTTGEETYEILNRFGNFPNGKLQTSCTLRYQDLLEKTAPEKPPSGNKFIIGIPLTTYMESDVSVVKCAVEAFKDNKQIEAKLKLHPMKFKENYKKMFEDIIPENFSFSDAGSADEFLDEISVLLYAETTLCFEAVAKGIPCVYIDSGKGILGDTMFNDCSLKWTAANPSELEKVFQEIISLSQEEIEEKRKKALEYIKKYFNPVSKEELLKFLEK